MEGGSGSRSRDDDEPRHLTQALQLPPLEVLVSYSVRNGREAELLLELGTMAARFDALFRAFVRVADVSHGLQQAWDQLWLAQDITVVAAIPIIGREMSRFNRIRARLTHLMDDHLRVLHSHAHSLRHFADINSTLAEELRMEGVQRLAADKERLVDLERGIELRLRRFLECSFDEDGES